MKEAGTASSWQVRNTQDKRKRIGFLTLTVLGVLTVFISSLAAALSGDVKKLGRVELKDGISSVNTMGRNGVIVAVYDPGVISRADADIVPGSAEVLVNINTAGAEELAAVLPGIGPAKAQAIVEYRELVGGFDSVWQLLEVDGIGEKILAQIVPFCIIEEPVSGSDAAENG